MTVQANLLGIYLNDHLTGAVGGVALAQRAARNHPTTSELDRLAREIEEDRHSLLEIMSRMRIRRTRYKEPVALVAERLGRFKPNGSIVRRSPLSSVVELEAMKIGVTGKLSCWLMLRRLADVDTTVPAEQLDGLIVRAEQQLEAIEQLRISAGTDAFVTT